MATGEEYLALAEALATVAHCGQSRKGSGEPYIEHPRRVAASVVGWQTKCVAWLHDVPEDTAVTPYMIQELFPDAVYTAVLYLTRTKTEKYDEYIDTLLAHGNRLSWLVKQADLTDNLQDAHGVLGKKHRRRYEDAQELVEHALWGDVREARS